MKRYIDGLDSCNTRMVSLTLNAVETNLYYSFGALEGAVSEINILMRKFSQVFVRLSLIVKHESKLNLLCSVPKHWATDFMTEPPLWSWQASPSHSVQLRSTTVVIDPASPLYSFSPVINIHSLWNWKILIAQVNDSFLKPVLLSDNIPDIII